MRKIFKTDIKEAASKRYRNQAGFLVLPGCVLACSGILQYGDVVDQDGKAVADGNIINVYRPPEALKACVSQFANLPLTITHPESQKVDPENAKEVVVGSLGSEPRYEEHDGKGWIVCDIIVYDENAINKVESGEFEELSAGYETAFQRQRGMEDGQQYEAVQFLLVPNHVALVEKGRCGSECKVCDESPLANNKQKTKETKMKKVVKYLLQMADGDEQAVAISEEQAEKMMDENPEIPVEEMDEDEVELEEFETDSRKRGGKRRKKDEEEDFEEEEFESGEDEDEDFEEEESESEEEEFETDGCGRKRRKKDEDDIEEIDPDPSEVDEDEESEGEMIYEVQFDDGSVGKMDENSYKHVSRFLELNKKGDAASTIAKATLLTSNASKVLGPSFDVTKFIANDSIDYGRIKKAIIKKVMPSVVTTSLKGDSLERIYRTAMETYGNKRSAWERDVEGISKAAVGDASRNSSPVDEARQNYLSRQNSKH